MCRARGMCLELLRWWNTAYVVRQCDPTEEIAGDLEHFTSLYIAREGFKIFDYKDRMEAKSHAGAMGCTRELLIDQLRNVMNVDGHAADEWIDIAGRFNSLIALDEMVGPFVLAHFDGINGGWKIERREPPLHFGALVVLNFCTFRD